MRSRIGTSVYATDNYQSPDRPRKESVSGGGMASSSASNAYRAPSAPAAGLDDEREFQKALEASRRTAVEEERKRQEIEARYYFVFLIWRGVII